MVVNSMVEVHHPEEVILTTVEEVVTHHHMEEDVGVMEIEEAMVLQDSNQDLEEVSGMIWK